MAKILFLLAFVFLMSCGSQRDLYPSEELSFPNQAQWQFDAYHKRINEFKQNPIGYNKIVFLGNSITEGPTKVAAGVSLGKNSFWEPAPGEMDMHMLEKEHLS